MDCDMLARDNISKLWELIGTEFSIQVVKHDYSPNLNAKLAHFTLGGPLLGNCFSAPLSPGRLSSGMEGEEGAIPVH